MKVYCLKDQEADAKVLKILIASRVIGEQCEVVIVDADQSPSKTLPSIETKDGVLSQTNAILRYIATLCPSFNLYGLKDHDSGLVDQVM